MKSLPEIQTEVQNIINTYPEMLHRLQVLKDAGYTNIHYVYVKNNIGLGGVLHLKRKHTYRFQVGYTELKKSYPAALVLDIPEASVDWYDNLPF
jgi:hypothetical protein